MRVQLRDGQRAKSKKVQLAERPIPDPVALVKERSGGCHRKRGNQSVEILLVVLAIFVKALV
jgi:hypothetical protein